MLRKTFTKPFFLLFFIVFSFSAKATTYYVSSSGNDGNSGTSSSSPWQTISKVNSFKNFSPGDNILFNRGNTFYGSITISNSGASGNPITFGAYGSGSNPIITGFTNVTSWTNLGGNIWESSNSVSSLSYCNMVVINGVNTPMGRYPNSGYLTYQSHVGNTSITSSSLTGSPNWTGADIVVKPNRWTINRAKITAQSGGTLTFTAMTGSGTDKFGFFIENDPRTLDSVNEWYFNPSTKKIRIYSYSQPQNVQVASVDNVIDLSIYSPSNLTFNNLTIQGANAFLVYNNYGNNISVTNSNFSYCGNTGIWMNGTNSNISNNTVTDCGTYGIYFYGSPGFHTVKYNVVKRTGLFSGILANDNSGGGIGCSSTNSLIQYNNIDSSGYCGINFRGTNTQVRNNFVNHSALTRDDAGGIYTGYSGETGKVIDGNIVLNTVGTSAGTNAPSIFTLAQGIFIDDNGSFITISNNTVSGGRNSGMKIHNGHDLTIRNNTFYSNGVSGNSSRGQIEFMNNSQSLDPIRNNVLKNNILFATNNDQLVLLCTTLLGLSDVQSFLSVADSNHYAVLSGNNMINVIYSAGWPGNFYNLSSWQAFTGKEANSKGTSRPITSSDYLRFEYNASASNKTVSLDANYIDVTGKSYNGTITLAPYTSAVLIRNGAITGNQPPTANAGADSTVILPTNTTTLIGSGKSSNVNGTITKYSWVKLSGPAATIVSPNSATTSLTGLNQGTYLFQLTVTDNNSATAQDTVHVIVNAANNLLSSLNTSNTVNGLNYSYYEASSYSSLPVFSTVTPVKTGTTNSFDITLANRSTAFSFNFTGYIYVPTDGQYTFYTNSDDGSNLYIDGVLVVNNDLVHAPTEISGVIGLRAGMHAISLGYFQQAGGSTLSVSYAGPGISKQIIPASSLYRVQASNLLSAVNPANTVNGLNYSYYEASSYGAVPSFNSITPVKTGTATSFDITLANRSTAFSFNFTGYIYVPTDGQYTFYTSSDDGSNLYIDNVLVVNNDLLHDVVEKSGTIGLKAGKHAISVGYFQQAGAAILSVSYGGPGISKQVIPSSALYRISGSTSQRLMSNSSVIGADSVSLRSNQVLDNVGIGTGIRVYPNPFNNSINININIGGIFGSKSQLILFDASGKVIWTQKIDAGMDSYHKILNTSSFASGVYFLQLVQGSQSSVIKLLKQY